MGPWVGSHSRDEKQQILNERMINEVRLSKAVAVLRKRQLIMLLVF